MIQALVDQATSLGLVETIRVETPAGCSRPATDNGHKQHLQFGIVVDFEATCWPVKTLKNSEIIEFPAVLVDLERGTILDEFHAYVQPSELPQLSEFCTELTGISQSRVDASSPLNKVLVQFHEWLKRCIVKHRLVLPKTCPSAPSGNAAFVTWSDWDFGVCLKQECQRKRLTPQGYFNQWMDLRALYRSWYNNSAKNFGDALRFVGMRFAGRPHSGIDDARNTARLACKMFADGCPLRVTQDLKPFVLFYKIS